MSRQYLSKDAEKTKKQKKKPIANLLGSISSNKISQEEVC